jgi:hypothetical protein
MPPSNRDTVVVPAGMKVKEALTSQSPAVREILVTLRGVAVVMLTPVPVAVTCSPTLPAAGLSFVTVPLMPMVEVGDIRPLAPIVVNEPARLPPVTAEFTIAVVATCVVFVVPVAVGAVGVPVIAGDAENTRTPVPVSSEITPASCAEVVAANCERFPLVSAYVVPHENPVALVYLSALLTVLQLGKATAVGEADEAVTFATTVFAACATRLPAVTVPHVGAVLEPVETIA